MRTVKKRSQKQEKSVANDFNAVVTVASGALWGMKADCRSEKCLIECKTTEKKYYPVTSKVWEKIEEEAVRDHMRIPLLVVDLEDSIRYVVFNPDFFTTEVPRPRIEEPAPYKKSYRLTSNKFDKFFDDWLEDFKACFFTICGKKRNMLCYMRIKDFAEAFKEEL